MDPSWVALGASRGNEDPNLKLFMRASVVAADLLVFFPAALYFVNVLRRQRSFTDASAVSPRRSKGATRNGVVNTKSGGGLPWLFL